MMDKHLKYSLIKSLLRVIGFWTLTVNIQIAAILLLIAEGFGIIKEL